MGHVKDLVVSKSKDPKASEDRDSAFLRLPLAQNHGGSPAVKGVELKVWRLVRPSFGELVSLARKKYGFAMGIPEPDNLSVGSQLASHHFLYDGTDMKIGTWRWGT
jgi:hypothetical protein